LLAEKDIVLTDNSCRRGRADRRRWTVDLLLRMDCWQLERGDFRAGARSRRRSGSGRQVRGRGRVVRIARRAGEARIARIARRQKKTAEASAAGVSRSRARRASRTLRGRGCRRVGLKLAAESVVRQGEFFLALDARSDARSTTREALVRIASRVEIDWLEHLFPQSIRRERKAVFDESRNRVVARGQEFYLDLLLREDADAPVDAQTASRVLAEYVTPERASNLLYADACAAQWLARYQLLRKALPNHPWPALTDDAVLRDAVAQAARGRRTLDGFASALLAALQSLLMYPLDRLMDTEAPESITVPTGNRIRLQYAPQNDFPDELTPPVLAVRLQELFGLTDTQESRAGAWRSCCTFWDRTTGRCR
jgi:ATP-dependent helicase HrpB